MKNINKFADAALRLIMAASSFAVFAVTFAQVIFRFVLSMPLPWSQDIVRLGFTYLIFSGAAWCVKEKAHLNVDVVLTVVSQKARKIMELAVNLILLGFFVFIFYFGLVFTQFGAIQTAPFLPIPMSWYYAGIPLSAALMFFYLAQQVARQIKGLAVKEMEGNR